MTKLLQRAVLFAWTITMAHAWTFSLRQQPEVCVGIELSVSGGEPPYTFNFLHPPDVSYDQIANLSAWASGATASWTFQSLADAENGIGDNNWGFTPLIIVGSNKTTFGSGGTTQAYTVLPEVPPNLPGCPTPAPAGNTNYLNYLQAFSTNLTECGNAWIQFKNGAAPSPAAFWVDTIVPLGQSFQTPFFNTSTTGNGTFSWPLNLTAGTNVTFLYEDAQGNSFITPIMTVQSSSNGACSPSGTLSSSPAPLPTDPSILPVSSAQRLGMGSGVSGAWASVVIVVLLGMVVL